MSKALACGMALIVLALAGAAYAYPTLSGPSGLMIIPTGTISPSGVEMAADWQSLPNNGYSIPVRALMSVGNALEAGLVYDHLNANAPENRILGGNLKFVGFNFLGGKSALGAQYLRGRDQSDNETDYYQGYFAWTSNFDMEDDDYSNMALTLGANWTTARPVDVVDSTDKSGVRYFAGLTVYLTDDLQLMGEFQSKNTQIGDQAATTSYGLRYRFNDEVSGQVGFTNSLGIYSLDHPGVFAGLDFTLPLHD